MTGVLADQAGKPWPDQRRRDPARAGRSAAAGPKGEAIAQAALRLFLRDGYERTSVDAIAAEAGVSKRTIYNRYGDKENLFRSVLHDTFTTMMATLPPHSRRAHSDAKVTDVQRDLTAFAREAAFTLTTAPDRIALIRLILAEAPYFPALLRGGAAPGDHARDPRRSWPGWPRRAAWRSPTRARRPST